MDLESIIAHLRTLYNEAPHREVTRKELSQILTFYLHCLVDNETITQAMDKLDGKE